MPVMPSRMILGAAWRLPSKVEPPNGDSRIGYRQSTPVFSSHLGLLLSGVFPAMGAGQLRTEPPLAVTLPRPLNQRGHRHLTSGQSWRCSPPLKMQESCRRKEPAQANGIIKAVIQFQSAFLKSNHPAVQQFFAEAHRLKFGDRAGEIEASFRQSGWSADSFDAVIEAGQSENAWSATISRRLPGIQYWEAGFRQSRAVVSAQRRQLFHTGQDLP